MQCMEETKMNKEAITELKKAIRSLKAAVSLMETEEEANDGEDIDEQEN